MNADFDEKLKELCIKYDAKAGHYPDPELVGLDLYKFYLHPEIDLSEYRTGNQYPEIDEEYKKTLEREQSKDGNL